MVKNRLWVLFLAVPFVVAISLSVGTAHVQRSNAQPAADPSCSSRSPCIEYENSSTGPAILGVGLGDGNGVSGEASYNSTSTSTGRAGVIGADLSSTGTFNSGVKGTSYNGSGVMGVHNNDIKFSSGAGVSGLFGSPSGIVAIFRAAVFGDAKNGNGVEGWSANSAGVFGESTNSDGVNGATYNKSASTEVSESGVLGTDASSDGGTLNVGVSGTSPNGVGVSGDSTYGIGVEGSSTNFVGVNAVGGFSTTGDFYPALSIVGDMSNDYTPTLINACPSGTANPCDENNAVFDVAQNGNISIAGEIYTMGGRCCAIRGSIKQAVRFYTPRESLPTVEDFGEAQLAAGHAYVRMDPAFADTIDQHANYLVFITPEGDSNVLFVSQKSVTGFSVTESRGGRDTIAFQYRIVAKPYGENAPRLQRFAVRAPRMQAVPSKLY